MSGAESLPGLATAHGLQVGRLEVNLGSGNEPLAGYVNVDRRRVPGVALVADVRLLPFATASVERVNASSLLEHFADPYAVLDEIHRVMRPGATATFRVPSPWSYLAGLDRSHAFLADLKLWRQIFGGYFEQVRVVPEGVRYRDNKLLAALNHLAVRGLRFYEFAQVWRFECRGKRATPRRAYIPWWLEPVGGADASVLSDER
jgi:SAM-dependent methyltransferase